jgi:hypothetical protein
MLFNIGETVTAALPVTPVATAVIVAAPAATPVASPEVETVTTEEEEEFQVTDVLRSWLDPSL